MDFIKRIQHELEAWQGVTVQPYHFGGIEILLGAREIGHIHDNGMLEIPFDKTIRTQLVQEGKAYNHPLYPETGWVSFDISSPAAIYQALWLLKLAWQYNRLRQYRYSHTLTETIKNDIITQLNELRLSLKLQAIFDVAMLGV